MVSQLFLKILRVLAIIIFLVFGCVRPVQKDTGSFSVDRYAEHVRNTEYQTPQQQLKGFKLPPGFEITLFASEPQIGKPMNMEFDDRGRLWLTQSTEYPMAAKSGRGQDKIMILEDTDGDGKADMFTTFSDTLNIPIGIMPTTDGVIAYSIPNIYYLRDRNDDGRADEAIKLFGPFGYADTHGMVNNFIRGFDGWVHSSHGFSNTSTFDAGNGEMLTLVSGNTFRFRTDGSRAEQTTFGRVNPFGFAYDERGYLYSVDCHSKPLYQLITEADYPHFGKKPTGIGFAPEMMGYELGSTALSGLAYYTGEHFPEEYRNNFFIGDVVTSRISRNSVSFIGSTPVLKFEEDFLLSADPWFRPVDIKIGPDGALYVADFYNRIIGHYEVDLKHPGRDRTSGRIWRITYKGGPVPSLAQKDWSKATLEELLSHLNYSQLNIRMRLADRIFDSFGKEAVPHLKNLIQQSEKGWQEKVQALWLLHRLNQMDDEILIPFLKHSNENLRIHSLRIGAQRASISTEFRNIAITALTDPSPFVRRSAAELLHRFPALENLNPLISLYRLTPDEDSHLKHTALLAIRYNLANPSVIAKIIRTKWSNEENKVLVKASIDLPDKTAANFVLSYLLNTRELSLDEEPYLEYVASQVTTSQVDVLAEKISKGVSQSQPTYLNRLALLSSGLFKSGKAPGSVLYHLMETGTNSVLKRLSNVSPNDLQQISDLEKQALLTAINFVGQHRIARFDTELLKFLPKDYPLEIQAASAQSLVKISRTAYTSTLLNLFSSPETPNEYKVKLVQPLAANPSIQVGQQLRRQLPGASRSLQIEILTTLLRSDEGTELVIDVMQKKEVPIDLLQVRRVKSAIEERINKQSSSDLSALLTQSESTVAELENLVASRVTGARNYKGNSAKGLEVFQQNCSACHQIKNEGGLVGPQLDGIGNWGIKALVEKILIPNRNITEAFKTYQINLKSGETRLGLYRRTEGENKVFADPAGNEFLVRDDQIQDYFSLNMTIMPDQFRHTIAEKDFYELIAFLAKVK